MEYEIGIRLDRLEHAVGELQQKVFPERFKEDKDKKAKVEKAKPPVVEDGA